MNDKFELNKNDDVVLHISTDQEIYFSIKDINQKKTMVSISEIYRGLKNIETLLGRDTEDYRVVIETSLANAYGRVRFVKEGNSYYMALDNYDGGSKVRISKAMFDEAENIDWNEEKLDWSEDENNN